MEEDASIYVYFGIIAFEIFAIALSAGGIFGNFAAHIMERLGKERERENYLIIDQENQEELFHFGNATIFLIQLFRSIAYIGELIDLRYRIAEANSDTSLIRARFCFIILLRIKEYDGGYRSPLGLIASYRARE